jgi:hypothetical protein
MHAAKNSHFVHQSIMPHFITHMHTSRAQIGLNNAVCVPAPAVPAPPLVIEFVCRRGCLGGRRISHSHFSSAHNEADMYADTLVVYIGL